MEDNRKKDRSIRFITSDYTDLFRIPDGGTIQVTFPDRQIIEKCEYIDDYHTRIGNSVFHICEYAQLLERNGGTSIPEPETLLKNAAWQISDKGYVLLERAEDGFRYEVLTRDFLSRTQGRLNQPSWTMNKAREHILDTLGFSRRSRTEVSFEMVKRRNNEVLKASDVTAIEWKSSKYYPSVRTAEHMLTCVIRGEQLQLTYEVSQHDDSEGFVIHSDGKDIWDHMPEPELRNLEPVLAMAVEYGHWKRDIDQAKTVEAVRAIRYGLYEIEGAKMTREQIRELHDAIDSKEAALMEAEKASKYKHEVANKPRSAKASSEKKKQGHSGPQIAKK